MVPKPVMENCIDPIPSLDGLASVRHNDLPGIRIAKPATQYQVPRFVTSRWFQSLEWRIALIPAGFARRSSWLVLTGQLYHTVGLPSAGHKSAIRTIQTFSAVADNKCSFLAYYRLNILISDQLNNSNTRRVVDWQKDVCQVGEVRSRIKFCADIVTWSSVKTKKLIQDIENLYSRWVKLR